MYTHLEDFILELFTSIDVITPKELDMWKIANNIGVEITYKKTAFRLDDEIVIKKGSPESEWQCFGHEVGHYFRHVGTQARMPELFKELQEFQADNFAYHFCVPTFMLEELSDLSIYKTMKIFNVEYEFAFKRLEMFQNKKQFNLLVKGVI